jgi:hypothetical protein
MPARPSADTAGYTLPAGAPGNQAWSRGSRIDWCGTSRHRLRCSGRAPERWPSLAQARRDARPPARPHLEAMSLRCLSRLDLRDPATQLQTAILFLSRMASR